MSDNEHPQDQAQIPALDKLVESVFDMSDSARFALRCGLEAITPAVPRPAPGKHLGVWDIEQDADGEWSWQVRKNLSLRERHSWRSVPLSSRRSAGAARAILVGSSAAASFGYWGEFSLATVLEAKLNAGEIRQPLEVIDLSCVNALWDDCLATLERAATLRADLVIVYAGNNEAKTLARRLRAGQLASLPSARSAASFDTLDALERNAVMHRCLVEHFERLVTSTVERARSVGVELVVVIPQYNLRDWQGSERIPLDLTGEPLAAWHRAVTLGEQYLQVGEGQAAEGAFARAIALDGGTCQRSLFGSARALTSLGADGKRQSCAYAAARDAGMAPFLRGIPQITDAAADAVRARLRALGVAHVDLREVLDDVNAGAPPSREHFIDYCHLHSAGIDLLAGAVARCIRAETAIGRAGAGAAAPVSGAIRPSPREECLACWVAAIHNYHHGQPLEVVRYWLTKSLAAYPPLRKLYALLSETLCLPWRERFTIAWFHDNGIVDLLGERHFFFFAKFFYHARFDLALVRLIDEVLSAEAGRDEHRPAAFAASTAPLSGASTPATGVLRDVSGQLYSLFYMDMRCGFVTSDRSAPRGGWERLNLDIDASEPVSIIDFLADGERDATLLLELSAPAGGGGELTLSLNGQAFHTCAIAPRWQRFEVALPPPGLVRGVNQLTFRWSHLTGLGDLKTPWERSRYVARYGHYPVAARIHQLQISFRKET